MTMPPRTSSDVWEARWSEVIERLADFVCGPRHQHEWVRDSGPQCQISTFDVPPAPQGQP